MREESKLGWADDDGVVEREDSTSEHDTERNSSPRLSMDVKRKAKMHFLKEKTVCVNSLTSKEAKEQ